MADFDEQPTFPYSDYYQCAIKYNLSSPNNSSVYKAREILLKPGFTGIAGFNADGSDPYPFYGNTIIRNPYFSCTETSSLKYAPISEVDEFNSIERNQIDLNSEMKVFPNPTTGIVKVQSEKETIKGLIVTDILGKIIYNKRNITESELNVDISNQTKGLYLFHISTDKGIKSIKILLQ